MRLFNEKAGHKYLVNEAGVSEELVSKLDLLGVSSIANVLMSIKFAKYYELTRQDILLTVFTDSMELYQSRLREARERNGQYSKNDAIRDFQRHLAAIKTDSMMELGHYDRKRIHHLKYFTWIEQQMFGLDELNRQWYDHESYWIEKQKMIPKIDSLILQFNEKVGLTQN
jgi:hypothetical protein